MATVHRLPRDGEHLTPCCGKTLFELPRTDRVSELPGVVTCDLPQDQAQSTTPSASGREATEVVADEVLDGGGPASFEGGPPAGWSVATPDWYEFRLYLRRVDGQPLDGDSLAADVESVYAALQKAVAGGEPIYVDGVFLTVVAPARKAP